jgi:hypothetical protein
MSSTTTNGIAVPAVDDTSTPPTGTNNKRTSAIVDESTSSSNKNISGIEAVTGLSARRCDNIKKIRTSMSASTSGVVSSTKTTHQGRCTVCFLVSLLLLLLLYSLLRMDFQLKNSLQYVCFVEMLYIVFFVDDYIYLYIWIDLHCNPSMAFQK